MATEVAPPTAPGVQPGLVAGIAPILPAEDHTVGLNTSTASSMANAIDDWTTIRGLLVGKKPVIFLDYDGTLSPIVKVRVCVCGAA